MNKIDIQSMLQSEQTKKIAIGLGVGIAALALIVYFFSVPARQAVKRLEKEIAEAQNQFKADQMLVKADDNIRTIHRQTACRLLRIMNETLAPNQNAVAWVSNLLYGITYEEGVAISEIAGETVATRGTKDAVNIALFEKFKATAMLRARYHNMGRFLAVLEKKIPISELALLRLTQAPPNPDGQYPPLSIHFEYTFPRFTEGGFPVAQRPTEDDCRPVEVDVNDGTDGGQ